MAADFEGLAGFQSVVSSRYFGERRGEWIFRGHSDAAYRLVPSVGRDVHSSRSRGKYERSLLAQFRRQSLPHVPRLPSNEFEWLALAQHHGLPTRLLDWSYNPLVALYFAVCAQSEHDGAVVVLRAPKMWPARRLESDDPLSLSKPVKFVPSLVTPRLSVQEGLFTVHTDVERPLEQDLRPDWRIESIRVASGQKQRLKYELYRVGVHESDLFPGLDGLARHLRWKHTVLPQIEEMSPEDMEDEV